MNEARNVTAVRLPIGVSDFRKLRQEGLHYADKTAFIKEIIDMAAALLRPEAADALRSKGEGQAFGGEVVYSPGAVLSLVQGPGAQDFDNRT